MTVPEDVLNIADREVGYAEYPPETNINKFGGWYGMNGVQWCAIFVSYCFYKAGLPLPVTTSKGFAYCPFGVEWFKSQDRFFSTPVAGDVAFFDWFPGTPDSDAWHIGIVERVNPDDSVTCIEGNTAIGNDGNGGQVIRQTRFRQYWYGFGRPNYSEQPNPPLPESFPQWPGRYITLTSPYTTGNDVLIWKQRMMQRGWDLGMGDKDVFDKYAYDVLQRFQREKGITADGVIGPISWDAAWELAVT